jgi:hypothetical protein
MSFLGKIGSAISRFFSRPGGAVKLGTLPNLAQKLGQASQVVNKLGIGGTIGKVSGVISKLPLEELAKTAEGAFQAGKQIYETAQNVRKALTPSKPELSSQNQPSIPAVVGGAGQPVVSLEDL